jgi:hypothetical protein
MRERLIAEHGEIRRLSNKSIRRYIAEENLFSKISTRDLKIMVKATIEQVRQLIAY